MRVYVCTRVHTLFSLLLPSFFFSFFFFFYPTSNPVAFLEAKNYCRTIERFNSRAWECARPINFRAKRFKALNRVQRVPSSPAGIAFSRACYLENDSFRFCPQQVARILKKFHARSGTTFTRGTFSDPTVCEWENQRNKVVMIMVILSWLDKSRRMYFVFETMKQINLQRSFVQKSFVSLNLALVCD